MRRSVRYNLSEAHFRYLRTEQRCGWRISEIYEERSALSGSSCVFFLGSRIEGSFSVYISNSLRGITLLEACWFILTARFMQKNRAIESQHGAGLSRVGRNDTAKKCRGGGGGESKNNETVTIDRRLRNIIEEFTRLNFTPKWTRLRQIFMRRFS